jgi:hypothetical protein
VRASDPLFAGLVLAVGVVYEVMALWMPRGRIGQPGPGFYPVVVGACLILTAAACLVQTLMTARRNAGPAGETVANASVQSHRQTHKTWLLLSFLVLYVLALKPLGFPIAISVLVIASIRVFGYRRWLPTLGIAAALTLVSYLTFVVWLKVPLPLGILDDLLD